MLLQQPHRTPLCWQCRVDLVRKTHGALIWHALLTFFILTPTLRIKISLKKTSFQNKMRYLVNGARFFTMGYRIAKTHGQQTGQLNNKFECNCLDVHSLPSVSYIITQHKYIYESKGWREQPGSMTWQLLLIMCSSFLILKKKMEEKKIDSIADRCPGAFLVLSKTRNHGRSMFDIYGIMLSMYCGIIYSATGIILMSTLEDYIFLLLVAMIVDLPLHEHCHKPS